MTLSNSAKDCSGSCVYNGSGKLGSNRHVGGHAKSQQRGNKGLKHGNCKEGAGARDSWVILLGLLGTFPMQVLSGYNEDCTREKFNLVPLWTALSTPCVHQTTFYIIL